MPEAVEWVVHTRCWFDAITYNRGQAVLSDVIVSVIKFARPAVFHLQSQCCSHLEVLAPIALRY
jgi:hypothetical protein